MLLELLGDAGTAGDGAGAFDLAAFTETWVRGDAPPLPGYERGYSAPRRDGRGGVAAHLADNQRCRFLEWKRRPEDGVLWLRISGVVGLPADLLVAVCYLPPDCRRARLTEWIDTLISEVAEAMAVGLVMVVGDLNARTAEMPDGTADEAVPPRRSADTARPNAHGREVLRLCHATGLRIGNGRLPGDQPAQPTRKGQGGDGTAVIDYCLLCPRLLPLARSLTVSPAPTAGGDHCAFRLDIALH